MDYLKRFLYDEGLIKDDGGIVDGTDDGINIYTTKRPDDRTHTNTESYRGITYTITWDENLKAYRCSISFDKIVPSEKLGYQNIHPPPNGFVDGLNFDLSTKHKTEPFKTYKYAVMICKRIIDSFHEKYQLEIYIAEAINYDTDNG